MDPATIALVSALAPTVLSAVKWGLVAGVGLFIHHSHSQTVQAVAASGVQAAQVAATAGANAAIQALATGAAPKDIGKAAGQAALGAAVGAVVAAPPMLGPSSPAQPADDHA